MPSLLQYLVEQFAEGMRQSAAAQRSASQGGATASIADDSARRAPYGPETAAPIAPPPNRRAAASAAPQGPAVAAARSAAPAARVSTPSAPVTPQASAAPGLTEPPAADPVLPAFAGGSSVRLRDAIVAAEILGKPLALRDW